MAEPSGPRASIGQRFVAALVDGLMLGVAGGLLQAILGQTVGGSLSALLGLAYYSFMEGSPAGQTVGKRAMGIRVIRLDGTGELGVGGGVVRYIGRFLSALPCGLGYFWAIWDDENQTWHDKIAGTVVVPVADYPI